MRWILVAALLMVSGYGDANAQDGPPQLGAPLPPVPQIPAAAPTTDSQIAELQAQIDQLRQQLEAQPARLPTPTAEEMTPSLPHDSLPSERLADDVQYLLDWQKSVAKAEAAAAAKAALVPSVKIGGRVFLDGAYFGQNNASHTQMGDAENAIKVRTAWVELGGNVLENTSYRLWFDLSGQVSILDAYVDFHELPYVQNVRIGHFFEPFGMEQLTPNKFMTFMERSSPFIQGRNMGTMLHSDDGSANWTYGLGVFVSEQGQKPPEFRNDNDSTAVTGRVTYLPWYDEPSGGRGLLHVGAAYSYRNLADDTIEFGNQAETSLAPEIVDTGTIDADNFQLFGLEAAYAYGSFMLQSEYHAANTSTHDFGSEYFDHYYIQASYFLTGEHRPYNRRAGSFANRVTPYENFFRVRTEDGPIGAGWGAWEVAYRYAHDDLNSDHIYGGISNRQHVALNWYLSPFTRAMFEYIYADTDTLAASDGHLHIYQMRLQYEF